MTFVPLQPSLLHHNWKPQLAIITGIILSQVLCGHMDYMCRVTGFVRPQVLCTVTDTVPLQVLCYYRPVVLQVLPRNAVSVRGSKRAGLHRQCVGRTCKLIKMIQLLTQLYLFLLFIDNNQ